MRENSVVSKKPKALLPLKMNFNDQSIVVFVDYETVIRFRNNDAELIKLLKLAA